MTDTAYCPICKRAVPGSGAEARFRPFCSKRCANIDLGRWLTGRYAIPAVDTEDQSETEKEEPESGEDSPPVRH